MIDRAGASEDKPQEQTRSGPSNLQLRVISSVVMIAAALALTFLGGVWFRLLAAAISAAIFYEWSAMARAPGHEKLHLAAGGMLAAVLLALVTGVTAEVALFLAGVAVGITLAAGAWLGHGRSASVGLAYATMSGISLVYLRGGDLSGLSAVIFLFAVVWATDILAYFTGRAIGGPKLAPSISPGKTWSGAAGGAGGGVAAGLLAAAALGQPVGIVIAAVALLLSVVSQVGDLFESAVKRRHGAKDSGSLIPGHGGVMDRVDGLVAAAFALYLIGWLAAGPNTPAHGLFPA